MARIFITGSADGLGRLTAQSLVDDGHGVIVHARSAARLGLIHRPHRLIYLSSDMHRGGRRRAFMA